MNVRRHRFRPLPLVALVLLGLFGALATVDLREARPQRPPRLQALEAGRGALRAGAGRAEVELPADPVLGGYHVFGRRPVQGAEPLHARTLLLEAGGARAALVLVELLTLPPSLLEAMRARAAAVGVDCVLAVATHTHSGPGGYDRAFLPQLVLGRFDEGVESAIVDAFASSLAAAEADLGPAAIASGEAEAIWLASNRDHRGAPTDARLTTLALERPGGERVATVVRFAAHPTLLPRSMGPAGDWPGLLMDRLDAYGGVGFVLQGAVGDARATRRAAPGPRRERAAAFAENVATIVDTLPLERRSAEVAVACAEVEIDLPPADPRGMVPAGLGTLAANLADPFAPRTAHVAAMRLDGWVLVGIPGEPLAANAPAIERAAEEAGLRGRVVGVAQGYVSYLVGEREMEARTPSARNAWFGEALAPRLIEGAEAAIRALFTPAHGDPAADRSR